MVVIFLTLGVAAAMILVELLVSARNWPRVRGWWPRAIALNLVQVGIAASAGWLWDPWLAVRRPWSADALGTIGSAVVGYLAITFIYYWWHRWRHEVRPLWRWVHQVHHSPQRIEILTSFYKHPLEIVLNGVLSSAIVYVVVGLNTEAAIYAVLLTAIAELIYHWNVPTPFWLGFVFQRPESHCVHHQTGVHAFNYGDLPLWDMLFGTFRNPRSWQATCGFAENGERQLGRLLLGGEAENAPLERST